MAFDARFVDWLDELHELNRLFLTYLRVVAEDGRACLGLPRRAARRLRDASPALLERIARLPTALFSLNIEGIEGTRELAVPERATDQLRYSLALTILSSAWHMARSRAFEARLFLHLSDSSVRQLRTMPLRRLPSYASDPDLLGCAFADTGLTWRALTRDQEEDLSRMLVLIALQPDAGQLPASSLGTWKRAER